MAQTQWHLLAECENEKIVESREREGKKVLERLDRALKKLDVNEELEGKCYEAFQVVEGKWVGGDRAESDAGSKCVPWYGLLDPTWVNEWWEQKDGGDVKTLRAGVKTWRAIAAAAVEACRTLWRLSVALALEAKGRTVALEAKERRRQQAEERNKTRKAGDKQVARNKALGNYRSILRAVDASKLEKWTEAEIMEWGRKRMRDAQQWLRRGNKDDALQVQKAMEKKTQAAGNRGRGRKKDVGGQRKITDYWSSPGGEGGGAKGIG